MTTNHVATIEQRLEQKLTQHFSPSTLQVINESNKHQGHSHHKGGVPAETGQTHFHIIMTAKAFENLSRMERHRLVYDVLADELNDGVHALALTLQAPTK